MRRWLSIFSAAVLTAALLVSTSGPAAASRLVSSFDTALGGLVSVAVGGANNSVYVYEEFGDPIQVFTRTGSPAGSIPRPGAVSNDFDLDVAQQGFTLGSGRVEAGSLLVSNGEIAPLKLFGVQPTPNGTITGELDLTGTLVGASYHASRNSVFALDWSADVIRELDPASGTIINEFPVAPDQTLSYDVFYGDVDIGPSGNLYVVSSSHEWVRELTPTGVFVRDWEVGSLGPAGMSGIDIDPSTGNAWIVTNRNGIVYEIALKPSRGDRVGCDPSTSTCGTSGDDELSANDGTIVGGDGDDTIEGIVDENTTELIIEAGAGKDEITLVIQDASSEVTVRVLGGGGADVISVPRNPGALSPNLVAGGGNDVIKVYAPTVSPRITAAQGGVVGRYIIDSGGGNDRIKAGITADRIKAAAGKDDVDGGAGNDDIDAGGGADELEGGTGNDDLGGGDGNDIIHGGDGANDFAGGPGTDTCLSDTKRDKFSGCERIRRNHRRNHGRF